jgi:hypothetical protein
VNEETFNISLRSFLKMVGINSQRAIEKAVRDALDQGRLRGDERLAAKMTLEIPQIGLVANFDGDIKLT